MNITMTDNRISAGLLAVAAFLTEVIIFFTSGAGSSSFWALAGSATLLAAIWIDEKKMKNGRLYLALAAGVMIVAGIILHGMFLDGFGTIANGIFQQSEDSQAYVYDKFVVSARATESPAAAQVFFIALASGLAGILLAFIPKDLRKWFGPSALVLLAAGFAYYGIVPPVIPMGLLVLVVMLQMCGGSLRTCIPLLVAAIVLIGTLLVISPGESKSISRADETVRDSLAVHTVRLEGQQAVQQEELLQQNQAGGGKSDQQDEQTQQSRKFKIVLGLSLLILAVLLIPAILRDRLVKRRNINRRGIDSEDDGEAVRAMFPYALRWLGICGIHAGSKAFASKSMSDDVRKAISEDYGRSFRKMADLWEKAVYSDQPVTRENREEMTDFVKETVNIVDKRGGLRGRIQSRLQQAL